jgi:hypothetical protein
VGDYKSDWNHRMAHIRVYDPRGFEFEISVENLLYILQECTSTKGKGLEGDFVYAWSGSDLVLLPTSSQEYVISREFTDGLSKKVSKADMKEGCVYITKKQEKVIYLGKQAWYEVETYSSNDTLYKYEYKGERHIFALFDAPKKYECPYFQDAGFTKLSSKLSDDIVSDYADRFDGFKKSIYGSGISEVLLNKMNPRFKTDHYVSQYDDFIIKIDNELYKVRFQSKDGSRWTHYGNNMSDSWQFDIIISHKLKIENNKLSSERFNKTIPTNFGKMEAMEYFEFAGRMLDGKILKIYNI